MLNINDIKFGGRMGSEPETRFLPNGDAVCNFRIAHGRKWKDQNGEWQEETTWLNVNCYTRLAEKVGKYGHKGSEVYVSGRLRCRPYQDKSGQDRQSWEIIANDVQFPGSAKDGEQPPRPAQSGNSYAAAKEGRATPNNGPAEPEFEDSIPF